MKVSFIKFIWLLGVCCSVIGSSCKKKSDSPIEIIGDDVGDLQILDGDGNEYEFVTIDGNDWLVENLKTTSFNDGTTIQNIAESGGWNSATEAAYCWYLNDASVKDSYGGLYNWYAVNSGKMCPRGWRVSSDEDWTNLIDFAGTDPADRLEELGLVPPLGGARTDGGYFASATLGNLWWISTSSSSERAYYRIRSHAEIVRSDYYHRFGMSCRCVRDTEQG